MHHTKERYSARFLKKIIEQNGCEINGRFERFASTLLGKGDRVTLHLQHIQSHLSQTTLSQTIDRSRVLFEDDALFIYDKPPGINCDEGGILALLKSSTPSLRLIHRLDRDTTGVLLLAKQPAIFELLVEQFKQFRVKKQYIAIVDGLMNRQSGEIANFLGRKRLYAGQTIWGEVPRAEGLQALTEWKRIDQGSNASLVTCFPKTGRTHQIRVHMAGMGHPILGDYQYGQQFKCRYHPPRILLHAESLQFEHPLTRAKLLITAPFPEEFLVAQQTLFKKPKSS